MARSTRGRFLPGNPGGPGNPHAAQLARMRSVLLDAVTDADIKAAMKALVKKARGGDLAALKLMLSYTIGKPPEALTIDGCGTTEIRVTCDDEPITFRSIITRDGQIVCRQEQPRRITLHDVPLPPTGTPPSPNGC